MSDPKPSDILGPNSIDSPIMELDIDCRETTPRSWNELIEELRAAARKRDEQQANPPKENGDPGSA